VQVWPAKPHADALVPAEHPTDVQHPAGQVDAVQAGCASPASKPTLESKPESCPESIPESATSIMVASEGPSASTSLSDESTPPSPGPSLPGAVTPPHELAESTNIAATDSAATDSGTRIAMPVQCPLSLESVNFMWGAGARGRVLVLDRPCSSSCSYAWAYLGTRARVSEHAET
jgi:hypothetical protein